MNTRIIGKEKETLVREYFISQGYIILEQNFTCKYGEIDLIVKKDEYLIFVEVKYRKNSLYGYPCEAVNYKKRNKIICTAKFYMNKYKISEDTPCRFDVAELIGDELHIIPNAFIT